MSAVMLTKNVAGDLQQLKGKKACFPSYDGYGKTKKIIKLLFKQYYFLKKIFYIFLNSFKTILFYKKSNLLNNL